MLNKQKIDKNILKKVKRYVSREIGTNVILKNPELISGKNTIIADLNISKPKIIYDDKTKERYIKFLRYDNVTKVEFSLDKSGTKMNISRTKLSEMIKKRRKEDAVKLKI